MFLTVFTVTTSVAISTWILFCVVVYAWHYLVEVVLDLPIIGQSPCSAHASLKLLIQRIIQEAIGLPALKRAQEHPAIPADDTNRTYEDLLATAILNKVIQNYQDELPTSSANSVSSRLSGSSRHNDKEYFFGEETLDTKWKNSNGTAADVDTTSVSSMDEWVRSDSSISSTKYVDHMSLTIQQRIEEVSSSDDESEMQTASKNTLRVDPEEWQENWTMQKRKLGGSASPVPVPMLVPNPTTEAKVLIGDRDAEDTTDLSDAGSEFGEAESLQGIESILVDSKTVIGGKNLLANVNVEEEIVSEGGSTDASNIVQEQEHVLEKFTSNGHAADTDKVEISETVNNLVAGLTECEDTSPTSLESHTEQDTEYTEKYATLPRTILKTPTPMLRDLNNVTESHNNVQQHLQDAVDTYVPKQNGYHTPELPNDENDQLKEKFKGSYSEREKEKWKNAVEMKNNPYSPENLNRRLSSQSSNGSLTSLFGRDYYIREAAKSAGGGRKTLASTEDEADFRSSKVVEQTSQHSEWHMSSPSISDTSIFKAVPALIDTESPSHTDNESSLEVASPVSPIRPNILELSSDSDLSVERVYNLHTGQVYEKVGVNQREIIEGAKSPEGIKYIQINTEFSANKLAFDENHNAMMNDKKRDFLRSLTESNETYSPTEDQFISHISSPAAEDVFSEHPTTVSHRVPLTRNTFQVYDVASSENQTTPCNKSDAENTFESIPVSDSNETFSNGREFSLEYSDSVDELDSFSSLPPTPLKVEADLEIVSLKDKHLVKDRLGLFSKSYPNLASVPMRRPSLKREDSFKTQSNNTLLNSVQVLEKSVNDLRRKFDYEQDPHEHPKTQVYSLTARSIPREFRQELKGTKHETESDLQISSITSTEEEQAPEEPKVFPNARSRIQFFENLSR